MGTIPREHFPSIRPLGTGRFGNHLGVVPLLCSGPGEYSSTISCDELSCFPTGDRFPAKSPDRALDHGEPHLPTTIPQGVVKEVDVAAGDWGGRECRNVHLNHLATVMPLHCFSQKALIDTHSRSSIHDANGYQKTGYKKLAISEGAAAAGLQVTGLSAQLVNNEPGVYVLSIHCMTPRLISPILLLL